MANEGLTNVGAIKMYFSTEGSPIKLSELKELSKEQRAELGEGARKELKKVS